MGRELLETSTWTFQSSFFLLVGHGFELVGIYRAQEGTTLEGLRKSTHEPEKELSIDYCPLFAGGLLIFRVSFLECKASIYLMMNTRMRS